jgi:PAS domain S-box-containing protein
MRGTLARMPLSPAAALAVFRGSIVPTFSLEGERITDGSDVCWGWLGRARESVIGRPVSELLHEADLPALRQALGKDGVRFRLRFLRDDGYREHTSVVRYLTATESMLYVEDRIDRGDGPFSRIKQERLLEERLLSGPVPMLLTDEATGEIILTNEAHAQLVGYPREQLVGRTSVELGLLQQDEREELRERLQRDGRIVARIRPFRRPDGQVRYLRFHSERVESEGRPCLFSIATDLTDLVRAQDEAAENAARFATLMDSQLVGIIEVNEEQQITLVNRGAERILRCSAGEIKVGRAPLDLAATVSRADALDAFARGEPAPLIELSQPGEPEVHILLGRAALQGRSGAHLSFFVDLSELRQSQREASQFAALIEASEDIFAVGTLDLIVTHLSRPGRLAADVTSSGPLALPILALFAPEDHDDLASRVLPAVIAGESLHGEARLIGAETGWRTLVEYSLFPVCTGALITGFGLVARPIGERRKLEEQLRIAQRMESLGRLAGGIAHDFNNMLSAILGFASLTVARLHVGDPIRDDVEQIIRAAERAAMLTKQLLAFSRKQMLEPKVLDVSAQVRQLESMLRRLLGEDLELELHLAPFLDKVKVDPTQLEQILMNLVINARDAVEEHGKVIIETANVFLDAEYARLHEGVTPGEHVLLAVADNGKGMPPQVRARAFDPFFTTKEPGKGTGLGLSTVHGIVRQSGGHVWLYSEEGHGTQVKVYFPITREAEVAAARPEPSPRLGGVETILLVEDEDVVRAFVRTTLRRAGYTVLEASNGGEGLLIAEQHAGTIHLLLTDVIMPRMNGKKLADRLGQVRPGLRVLYMSGYTENTIVHQGVVDGGTFFLAKPVAPDTLLRMVRLVLESAPPP